MAIFWWKCPKCGAQHGTPTLKKEKCRNCGTKMERKKLKDLE
jgi:ribosomal protein L40E